jgi:predicted HicB family RNase H-like nuclease
MLAVMPKKTTKEKEVAGVIAVRVSKAVKRAVVAAAKNDFRSVSTWVYLAILDRLKRGRNG